MGEDKYKEKLIELRQKVEVNLESLTKMKLGMSGERMAGYYDGQEATLKCILDEINEALD